jgi:hypothetical protein
MTTQTVATLLGARISRSDPKGAATVRAGAHQQLAAARRNGKARRSRRKAKQKNGKKPRRTGKVPRTKVGLLLALIELVANALSIKDSLDDAHEDNEGEGSEQGGDHDGTDTKEGPRNDGGDKSQQDKDGELTSDKVDRQQYEYNERDEYDRTS